jgi:predicted ester cyclase
MNSAEILNGFAAALKAGDIERAGSYLSDDFEFRGPAPTPLDKTAFLRFLHAQKASFPDWSLHIRCLVQDGDRVIARVRILGQPTSLLLIAAPDALPRRELGEFLAAPEERHEYHLRGDRIAALQVRQSRIRLTSRFSVN